MHNVEIGTQPGLEIHCAAIDLVFARGVEDLDLFSQKARTIDLASSFHGAVMNGGFAQYPSSSGGNYAVETSVVM